eukprot:562663_1
MEGDIDINCHAQTGSNYILPCENAVIEAHDTTGILTVDCKGTYGCYGAQIHCRDSDCNVICDEVDGCFGAQIHVGDHGLDTIHFDCDDTATSCSALSIHCDSGGESSLMFDNNTWKCIGLGCCPWKNGEIICVADEPCFLTFAGDSNCRGYSIDATNATSLVIYCLDASSCEGMKVSCPKGIGSSCTFNCAGVGSCDDALIHTHADHQINEFTLNCQSRACMRLIAVVNVSTISTVNVLCNNAHACEGVHLGITGIVDDAFALDCGAEGACQNAAFVFKTTNVDINCVNPMGSTSNVSAACGDAEISIGGDHLGIAALYCDAYDCSSLAMSVNDATSVNVYCTGDYSCHVASFYLDQSSNVSLFCDGWHSCNTTHVACPSDQIGVCNIDCKGVSSCSSLSIGVSSYYAYGYLRWNCDSSNACDSLFIDCEFTWRRPRVDATYSYNTGECVQMSNPRNYRVCCPIHQGTKVECAADEYCLINCDNSNCNNVLIDGSVAQFLEVYCGTSYSCNHTNIICPSAGCDITCGATTQACHWMDVQAPFANVVNFNCSGTDSCHDVLFNAQYANIVNLYFGISHLLPVVPESYYEWSAFVMNNAKQVSIDFIGASFSNFNETYIDDRQASTRWTFYAENASAVTINCLTPRLSVCGTPRHGWQPTYWYYPPNRTTFNCYGTACAGLWLSSNTIPQDVSSTNINIYSCGQCGSTAECIDYMILFCGETYSNTEWVSFDRMATECRMPLYGSQGCECDALVSNINFYLIEGAQNCSEPMTHFSCDMNQDCTLNCDSSHNCQHWIVDGRNGRSLTVNCESDYVCQNSFIYCPTTGGCEILCNGHSSCRYVKISSNSTAESGDTVSLRCTGGEYACANMELDARQAAYVVIHTDVYRGFHGGVINANDVNSFILNATNSAHTFSSNEVRIERAKHVVIACHSTNSDGGCDSNTMFLPNDPILQCYGYGCLDLGDIYIEDTSNNAQWYVNGCGLCNGGSECIYNLSLHCNSHFRPDYYDYYFFVFDYYSFDNDLEKSFQIDFHHCNPQTEFTEKMIGIDCGCYDMFHEQMVFINEAQCVLPKRTQYPTLQPSLHPILIPNTTQFVTLLPSNSPTRLPSNSPTRLPSNSPTRLPSNSPTRRPVDEAEVDDFEQSSTVHPDPIVIYEPGDDTQLLNTATLIGLFVGANVLVCSAVVCLFRECMKRKIKGMMANDDKSKPPPVQRVKSLSIDPGAERKCNDDPGAEHKIAFNISAIKRNVHLQSMNSNVAMGAGNEVESEGDAEDEELYDVVEDHTTGCSTAKSRGNPL